MAIADREIEIESAFARAVDTEEKEREVRELAGLAVRDVVLFLLAVASVALLVVDELGFVPPQHHATVVFVDLAIVIVFAAEFVWRMASEARKLRFVARNWFDVLGLFPLLLFEALQTLPQLALLRAFRLVRIARIVAVLSRAARAYNAIAGEKAAQRIFRKYRAALVEEITDRVALQLIAQMERNVVEARYPEAIGRALETRREDVRKVVLDSLERTAVLRPLARFAPSANLVERTADALTTIVADTLKSPEVNRIVAEAIAQVLANLKGELAKKDWKEGAAPAGPSLPI
ncbi:MAG TPA: ion transporter [Candidatus Thermoplasmatota archaeon]|nr:ion transporter [Candidatus Thermoplasmatota archaeon]